MHMALVVCSRLPPTSLHHQKGSCSSFHSWQFPSFTRITACCSAFSNCRWSPLFQEESKPIHFSPPPPRPSRFNNLYQDQHEELGFKKQEENDHRSILESHRPYKTAPPHAQYKREEERDGIVCDESQSLNFVSHFSTGTSGAKGGPTVEDDEDGLDLEMPRPQEEEDNDDDDDDTGGPVVCKGIAKGTRRRQIIKRSTMIAKQVISIQSALSLGFVSQLWVDANAWEVLFVEVKPNLLSSELERFSLDDLVKVGDVVLIEDESVMENDFKLMGLETLVGYTVATPGRRNIGKVRGYNFNINSGVVESLEIDSFGISIIPSSLVSTYALFVEDVLEVLADTVVVHEAAASRMQRLTKGFWGGGQKMGEESEEGCDYRGSSGKRSLSRRKFAGEVVEGGGEWELPMDYL